MGTKEVTYKHLTVGQEVKGVRGEGRYQGFTGYVDEINPAFVTVAMWRIDGRKEQYSTDYMFIVEMTNSFPFPKPLALCAWRSGYAAGKEKNGSEKQ